MTTPQTSLGNVCQHLATWPGGYRFGMVAATAEAEWIHRLNHDTFVRELPQHEDPGAGVLVDKFHAKNIYYAAWLGDEPVGMVAVNDEQPFSVMEKLPAGFDLEGLGPAPLEVRLFAVAPGHRDTCVALGLVVAVLDHARRHGHTHLLISGAKPQLPMYRQMGFRPLGEPVQRGEVSFVPMSVGAATISRPTLLAAERFRRRLEQG